MTAESFKTQKWAIVDKDNNIIETFRLSTTANQWKDKLEKQYMKRLEIKKLTSISNGTATIQK